jgi:hypothetical protein
MLDLKKDIGTTKLWERGGVPGSVLFPESVRELPREATDTISGHSICGNKLCTKTRASLWRNRRRPFFEGSWVCSGRCMLNIVQAAIRRECRTGALSTREEIHRHRVPLGLLLQSQGWITRSQLEDGLERQRSTGGRIGEILVDQGYLSEDQVSRGLSIQWGCPVFKAVGFSARQMALAMPSILIEEFGIVPLRVSGEHMLHLGFETRPYPSLALALEQMTDLKVAYGLVSHSDYVAVRTTLLSAQSIAAKIESIVDRDSLETRITAVLEDRQPINARIVRVQQFLWLRLWLEHEVGSGIGMLPQGIDDIEDYVFKLVE